MGAAESPQGEITPQYIAAVDRLTQHVQVVQDILDEVREELQYAVRNEAPIRVERLPVTVEEWNARLNPDRRRSSHVPESIACTNCDIDSPDSLAAALEEGWTELSRDDGYGWNYLGLCPHCLQEEIEESQQLNANSKSNADAAPPSDPPSQKELF